jgi:hypothetical protein
MDHCQRKVSMFLNDLASRRCAHPPIHRGISFALGREPSDEPTPRTAHASSTLPLVMSCNDIIQSFEQANRICRSRSSIQRCRRAAAMPILSYCFAGKKCVSNEESDNICD